MSIGCDHAGCWQVAPDWYAHQGNASLCAGGGGGRGPGEGGKS